MATTYRRQEDGFPARGAKFFKIIIDPRANMLRIPAKFMRKNGNNLPKSVFLKVPSGSLWKVEFIQSNGDTWLHSGWQEFRDYHSISFGNFLVFDYNGNTLFNVLIFDMSACEIDYPFAAANFENAGSESDDSVVFLEEVSTKKNGRDKGKMNKRSISDYQEDAIEFSDMRKSSSSARKGKDSGQSSKIVSQSLKFKKQNSGVQVQRVVKETSIVYQKAVAFKSDNPTQNPFVICIMQPSYVSRKYNLNVPLAFCEENLPDDTCGDLTLCALNGKTWSVRCNLANGSAKIHYGWKKFVQDNALKVGDVCIIEVRDSAKLIWNVMIFRS